MSMELGLSASKLGSAQLVLEDASPAGNFGARGQMKSDAVRQAVLSDLDEIANLFDQYRQFQGQESCFVGCREFLRERFSHGQSVIFLGCESGVTAGFVQLYPSFSSVSLARVFILNDLFVAQAGRRKGLASKLLRAAEEYARVQGAVRISLSVAIPNSEARALYEARGWARDEQFYVYHRFPSNE